MNRHVNVRLVVRPRPGGPSVPATRPSLYSMLMRDPLAETHADETRLQRWERRARHWLRDRGII